MTFSDNNVQRLVNKHFICARLNTDGQSSAGGSFAHDPKEPAPSCIRGNGKQNVQLLAMTPEGEIFHVLVGFISPKALMEELRFAVETFRQIEAERPRPAARQKIVTDRHQAFAKDLGQREFSSPLGNWERRRAVRDHTWIAERPLMNVKTFRPEMLVGNGREFFGSSSGKKPAGKIGKVKGLDLPPGNGARASATSGGSPEDLKELLDRLRKRAGNSEGDAPEGEKSGD